MKLYGGIAAAVLLLAALPPGGESALAQGSCDHGGFHVIQVRADDNDVPTLSYRGGSAEVVRVCLGDRIQWTLIGPNRSFFVNFAGELPYSGGGELRSNRNVITIVVGGAAERGDAFDYDVAFADGGELDPRIVVD